MSAFGNPPEGLDLTESRVSTNNVVVGLVMGIATVFLALRFWARTSPVYRVGIDDWWTGAAMVGPFCPGKSYQASILTGARYSRMEPAFAAF